MIIGTGLIAKSLQKKDADDVLYFASGVSNSLEVKLSEFEREIRLLEDSVNKFPDAKVVYFSTLSIFDQSKKESLYVRHKLRIEEYIRSNCKKFLILRIGNIVGSGGNANTLFNYLKTKIDGQDLFAMHKNARRLLIDIDDIPKFIEICIHNEDRQIINCAYPYYYDLKEIITVIQNELQTKAIYDEIDEGDFYQVEFDEQVTGYFSEINPDQYLTILAKKYI